MTASVELQVISKVLTSDNVAEVDELLSYGEEYYSIFRPHIQFILAHRSTYGSVPDVFTFQSEFTDVTLVQVSESQQYLLDALKKNRQRIILVETFNKIKDLDANDVSDAWRYLSNQCNKIADLNPTAPMDIISDASKRAEQVIEFSKQTRIPTGFAEIDKLMYGGLSTVEELLLIIARSNTGKSWICTRMMESAQANGFPVAYYSPEMQASYLATRFDTWRAHFQNNLLYQGKYTNEYNAYITKLSGESTPAYIIEDKDMPDGVSPKALEDFIRQHGIKLMIVDGLSYMSDDKPSERDHEKYKHICGDLFRISKKYGCAMVIAVQANRDTQLLKDDKGEAMPTLYNIEGSDHPGRICTQAFSLRQVFDKHVLDIRLEKSRMANNQKPILSYAWDVNTGNCQYLSDPDNQPTQPSNAGAAPRVQLSDTSNTPEWDDSSEFEDEDVEF